MPPTLPAPIAQPWIFDPSRTPPVYTRPVVGSELLADRASSFGDGLGDVCIGVDFTSSLNKGEIQQRTRRALAKLRFFCPIIAATIEGPDDGIFTRRWVYAPMQDISDCESWLDAAFSIQERGSSLDIQEFVDSRVRTRLPVDSSGKRSLFQCYLLTDDVGAHGLYFHGSHCILDAWPTMFALGLMIEWMVADPLDTPINLEFGTEHKNLPLDPVSVSGGPRESWGTSSIELFAEAAQRRTKTTPILALLPPSQDVCTNGPRVRFEHVFPPSETEKFVTVSKCNNLSLTHLLEAAHCVALAASNPALSLSSEVDFSAESTIVSLEREFVKHVNKKTHFITAHSVMPIRIPMSKILDVDSTREQLLLAASALKAEYVRYLANPCLPHMVVAQTATPPCAVTADSEDQPLPQFNATMLMNLGKVATRLPSEYVSQSGERILHVRDLSLGHRITTPHVLLHSWTLEDGLHIQLQASDVWALDSDRAYLERFFDTMRRLVLEQLY
ncbi:hypothetical protein J3R82DRAFT_1692 [Butyriboletus roseoflavus]|nr:hypothetical protein J3R82DRAFT_1692 [Butyriboletus roseoflavus]